VDAVSTVFNLPRVRKQLALLCLVGIALALQRSSFAMMTDSFHLDASKLGLLMSFMAIVSMVTNILVGYISHYLLEEQTLMALCAGLLSPTFISYTFVSSSTSLMLVLVPLAVFSTVVYTLNTSTLTKIAKENAGLVIGLNHSIRSGLGIVAPTAAAYLLLWSPSSIGYVGAVLCGVSAFYLLQRQD